MFLDYFLSLNVTDVVMSYEFLDFLDNSEVLESRTWQLRKTLECVEVFVTE